ncbi:hypothetical protein [Cellulomonas alba]|uniref:Uncharacterized protein n=1 Tax=Cellulomonas alba TaxID=3053467 RepID=A0ABT7SEC1_9CELL|nr:hypothetical protein [Cellulomonas alba]MDM7854529.1 hypothetical protein [Cellulomonas alba]
MNRAADARRAVRGDLLLHPVALVSLAVLLVNDHLLKQAAPGWVTGKLSDVAGLAFFPFLLLAVREVVTARPPTRRAAAVVAAVTGAAFAAIKLSTPARSLYAGVMGVLRFPADALVGGAQSPLAVAVQPDATDVVAVVACFVAVLAIAARRPGLPGGLELAPIPGPSE